MLILNFSHPLTPDQLRGIEMALPRSLNEEPEEITVRNVPAQFDPQRPFAEQVEALVEACGLTAEEWQSVPLLIVPPALNFIAVALLAHLHGRMGYFPDCVRLRPVENARPPRFEVAEILNLQSLREMGRGSRVVG
jgi:hypothetical protein